MAKIRISLTNAWEFDDAAPLGNPGGFGEVFAGVANDGHEVAVKRLKVSVADGAHRELRVATEIARDSPEHLVRVLDAGIDSLAGGAFVVMERCETSLQEQLAVKGRFAEEEAREVLLEASGGLLELGSIVHRDIKPHNILRVRGKWCLADLGLAKYLEESTSAQTLRDCMSPLYAAPEQWRMEATSRATDIYGLGCVAYALLTGAPPFSGTREEVRKGHLNQVPPPLNCSPQLARIVELCLRKDERARPSLAQLREGLSALTKEPPASRLAQVATSVAREQAAREAKTETLRDAVNQMATLASDGMNIIRPVVNRLFEEIRAEAAIAVINATTATLGKGRIAFQEIFPFVTTDPLAECGIKLLAGCRVSVSQKGGYPGRSANLWFADWGSGGYQWHEVAYKTNGLTRQRRPDEPFGIEGESEIEIVRRAHGRAIDVWVTAHPVLLLSGVGEDAFVARWKGFFADAADGSLREP